MTSTSNVKTVAIVASFALIATGCSSNGGKGASPGSTEEPGGGGAGDLTPFTVVLDFLPNGEYGPLFAALESGAYEDVGLDVTIERGSGSADTIKRIASNQGDLGMADFSALLGTRADEGVEVKAVGSYFQKSAHSFFFLESSGMTEPADLEGKQLAISPGNSHQIIFPYFAEKAGIDPESVTWVSMDAGAMGPAMIQGQVDAAPFLAVHETRLKLLAEEAGETTNHFAFSDFGVDFSALSFVARDASVADPEESDAIRRFLGATYDSMNEVFVNGEYDLAADAVMAGNPELNREAVVGAMKTAGEYAITDEVEAGELSIGEFSEDRVANTVEQYITLLEIEGDVVVEDLYTNELLPAG